MNLKPSSVGKTMMRINFSTPNLALISIIEDPEQVITLDANFLIPPYRSRFTKKIIEFYKFREIWLDPIFGAFPNLAIHEAVYDELVGVSSQAYIDTKRNTNPTKIIIHKDSSLTEVEKILKDTIESRIASFTKYDPMLDNKDELGDKKAMKMLYKYQYYLTDHEKCTNPSWGDFNTTMKKLYESYFK